MNKHGLGNGRLLALCALAMSALVLAGCGGESSTQPAAANPAGEVLGDQSSQPAGGQSTTPVTQAPPNTTSAFGIPAGLTGSVAAGQTVYANSCAACHGSLSARNYGQITSALNIAAMRSIQLSEQQLADLTAYLNRNSIPPPSTDPPQTSPPPATPPATSPPPSGGTGDDDDEFDDDDSMGDGDDDAFDDENEDDDEGSDLDEVDGSNDEDNADDDVSDEDDDDEEEDD